MIKLIKLVSGQSVCGEYIAASGDKGDVILRRPLNFHAMNDNCSVYEPTYLSLLKYDFISETEQVAFNGATIISITDLIDEAAEWYNIVAEFVYDITKEQRKNSLKAWTEVSVEYQKKVVEAIKAATEASTGQVSNNDLIADSNWAEKVDTKIQN
jgi:hypothetical protein